MAFSPQQQLVVQHHKGNIRETSLACGLPERRIRDLLRGAKVKKAILEKGFPILIDPTVPTSLAYRPPRAPKPVAAAKAAYHAAKAASPPPTPTGAGATMSIEEVVAELSAIGRGDSDDKLKAIDMLQKLRANNPEVPGVDSELMEEQRLAERQRKREERDEADRQAYVASIRFATRRYVALARCEFEGKIFDVGGLLCMSPKWPDPKFFKQIPSLEEDFHNTPLPATPLPAESASSIRSRSPGAPKNFLED